MVVWVAGMYTIGIALQFQDTYDQEIARGTDRMGEPEAGLASGWAYGWYERAQPGDGSGP